jgi:type IV secretion system protein VirB10
MAENNEIDNTKPDFEEEDAANKEQDSSNKDASEKKENIIKAIKNKLPNIEELKKKKGLQLLIFVLGGAFTMYNLFFTGGTKPVVEQKNQNQVVVQESVADDDISSKTKNEEKLPQKDNLAKEISAFAETKIDDNNTSIQMPSFDMQLNVPPPVQQETVQPKEYGQTFQKILENEKIVRPTTPQQPAPNQDNTQTNDPVMAALLSMESGPSSKYNTETESPNENGDYILLDENYISKRKNSTQSEAISKLENPDTTIPNGAIIDAALTQAISSEKPGQVSAVIVKDVYGQTGDKRLIPKGSKIFGTYTTTAAEGETRIGIIWSRVQRPDGVTISVNAYAADQLGQTGIEADVNNKYGKMFENSLMLSFLTLGSALAAEKVTGTQQGQTTITSSTAIATTNITPVNAAVNSIISTSGDIARKMAERFSKVNPTLTVPHGTGLKIIVNQNIEGIPPVK